MIRPQNQQRFDRLKALSPIEAVRVWLEFSFGMGDEPALIAAIRRDPRITLSDDRISEVVREAMDEELDATACLQRLVNVS